MFELCEELGYKSRGFININENTILKQERDLKNNPIFYIVLKKLPTYPLRRIMLNNACPNRIAETSGTDFSQDFLYNSIS